VIVDVDLGERSYDIVVEAGARHRLRELLSERAPNAQCVALVTSVPLESMPWFDLDSGVDQFVLSVPDGEAAKTMLALEGVLETLAGRRLSRDDVIVGVGGGAVTDLAGFAASVYLRGVALVQVPTSLVGQVDAAIGGKTAVNLRAGKNLVGAFHQPLGVLCDTAVLDTLPERDRRCGLGEIAKCWLLEGRDADELAGTTFANLIATSVRLKASLVVSDEFERGARVLLNYGHTLAHALEKIALARDTDELRHGEAVAIGVAFAPRLAKQLGRVDDGVIATHDAVLDGLGLERRLPRGVDAGAILEAMSHDKKAHHDLSFVLPGSDGFALVSGVNDDEVRRALDDFKGES